MLDCVVRSVEDKTKIALCIPIKNTEDENFMLPRYHLSLSSSHDNDLVGY